MIKDYFLLAFKNLRQRGLRSWLTILGVFIGIAAVVSLISMGQGLETAVLGQFGGLSLDKLNIQNKGTGFGPPGSTVVEKLNDHDVDIIKSVNGVDEVITRLIRVVKIEYNKVSGFGYIADIPEDSNQIKIVYDSFEVSVEEGRLLKQGDKGKVFLGNDFKDREDFEKEIKVGKKILLNDKEFEVIGILEKSSSFQLNSVIFMMSDDLQDLLEIKDEYDLIVAQIANKDNIEEVAQEIERKLRNDRNEKLGEETFSVETPLQSLESVNTILGIINIIVVGIAMISLFIGGVGIANTMYTGVVERTQDIGIMKAIGAQNKDILMIFLIESGLLGLAGGIAGAIIGFAGAKLIGSFADQFLGEGLFPIAFSLPLILGAIGFSFVVGILSGIFPALQASKLNVVDAIRS